MILIAFDACILRISLTASGMTRSAGYSIILSMGDFPVICACSAGIRRLGKKRSGQTFPSSAMRMYLKGVMRTITVNACRLFHCAGENMGKIKNCKNCVHAIPDVFNPEDIGCGVPLPPGIVRWPIEYRDGKFHSRDAVFDTCSCWKKRRKAKR